MSWKEQQVKQPRPLWQVIVLDVLMAALILAVYAAVQLGLPILSGRGGKAPQPSPTPSPQVLEPSPEPEPLEEAEIEPEATPDTRTEWQIRFAEHFTDEVVITDHSYQSPRVSITLETRTAGEGSRATVYHVADIYVADLELFRSATANGEMRYFGTQDMLEMDRAAHAVLAISGDFFGYQKTGVIVRNGEIYTADTAYSDICVLYRDGSMRTFDKYSYDPEDIMADDPWQVWNFGPLLLDEDGHVKDSYDMPQAVSYPNPRSSVGYYEPGHYCFVVVDGRQDGYSYGWRIPELAALYEELGCRCAYNLDGGGSAVMSFLHEKYSSQSNGGDRALSDILLITDEGFD